MPPFERVIVAIAALATVSLLATSWPRLANPPYSRLLFADELSREAVRLDVADLCARDGAEIRCQGRHEMDPVQVTVSGVTRLDPGAQCGYAGAASDLVVAVGSTIRIDFTPPVDEVGVYAGFADVRRAPGAVEEVATLNLHAVDAAAVVQGVVTEPVVVAGDPTYARVPRPVLLALRAARPLATVVVAERWPELDGRPVCLDRVVYTPARSGPSLTAPATDDG